MKRIPVLLRRLLALLLLTLLPFLAVRADDTLPPNLGRGLRPLVEWQRTQPAARTDADRQIALTTHLGRNATRVQSDGAGRVTVDIRLDGTVPAAEVKKNLAALGLALTGEHAARRADGRDGILTAHLPLDQAAAAARIPGVFSVLAAHGPHPRVGAVTSQGVTALHADAVQAAGFDGTGITVGVISDSYDVATQASTGEPVTTNSAEDIATGDLPAAGVTVLQDGSSDPNDGNTDEGRAMLQIVHDVAPGATLAFCTCGETQSSFAENIRLLRTSSNVNADIIVDDIGFDDEPFFSDSIIAQAVDDVVTSTTLAGRPVLYYSAAGNDGDLSYAANFTPVTNAAARAGQAGVNNLQLSQVPTALTAGGFHNFKDAATGKGTKIVQQLTVSGDDAYIDFQWDDPFVEGKITADYNILVFDQNGNYLDGNTSPAGDNFSKDDLPGSGIDNNFSTGEAVEFADLPLQSDGSDTVYQIAITQASTETSAPASQFRYIVEGEGIVAGKYLQTGQPTLFGHSGATNADGVGAYDVHDLSTAESYESFGPVTIYFDDQGNRLATPQVRQQPTIATVDGVDTTFFPEGPLKDTDSDSDGFPNFYGTSAAAPHAAAVAALLLQAAGGKGSLSSTAMRSLLQSTATNHDLDPAQSTASFSSPDGLFHVTVTAQGDGGDNSAFSSRFFTLTYIGPAGSSLRKAAIDIGSAGEDFDESSDDGSLTSGVGGFPFTIGLAVGVNKTGITTSVVTDAAGHANALFSLIAPLGAFPSGGSLSFGIDRDDAATGNGGNDADVLAGSTVAIRFVLADGSKEKISGTFVNQTGHGYSPDVGFGLINAQAALQSLGK